LKTNVFWGGEDWFSKTGCWTGCLPRLAKCWVSTSAGTRERKGARGWEGGQSCSFIQQQGRYAAGFASRPQWLVVITGREAEQKTIAPLSRGEKCRSGGKAAFVPSLLTSPSSQLINQK